MERNTQIGNIVKPRASNPDSPPRISGFTLIEMIIVMILVSVLAAIAVPAYQAQILRSKETVLQHNLAVIRERLDQHKADRHKFPESLTALVEAGYLKEIPEDPITSSQEWEEVFSDYNPDEPDAAQGIEDIHSSSAEVGSNGTPYSEW